MQSRRNSRRIVLFVALSVTALLLGAATQVQATSWDWTDTSTSLTYRVVEADPFYEGGAAGNTVAIATPGTWWAKLMESGLNPDKWSHRAVYAINFNVLGGAAASAPDVFENHKLFNPPGPDLRTTISGLSDGTYDVFLVQAVTITTPAMDFCKADIETLAQTLPTTDRQYDANCILTEYHGTGGNSNVYAVLTPLGQITGTSFSVLVGRGTVPPLTNRGFYMGVAYRAVPEPSTLVLLGCGLIGLLAYAWRKRK